MNASTISHDPRAKDVRCTADALEVFLQDGRKISAPIAWFPRLLSASPEDRAVWELSAAGKGIHWPKIDEDLSVRGLLAGANRTATDDAVFDHSARTKGFFQEGVAFSAVWIVAFVAILWATNSIGLLRTSAADLGGLLSGAFAPLALIWFIVALRHQAAELAQNTDALRLQVREMKEAVQEASRQAGALEGNLKFSQIDIMYRTIEMDWNQLNTLVGTFLTQVVQIDQPVRERAWTEYSAGNRDALLNMALAVVHEDSNNWHMQIRSRAQTDSYLLRSYVRVYDALVGNIERLDQTGTYKARLQDGAARKYRDRAVRWLSEMGQKV